MGYRLADGCIRYSEPVGQDAMQSVHDGNLCPVKKGGVIIPADSRGIGKKRGLKRLAGKLNNPSQGTISKWVWYGRQTRGRDLPLAHNRQEPKAKLGRPFACLNS